MRYIAELELENFQCHEHTRLTFGPGLNVIVGPSDQGKTALLRALRWVLYNEPRGSDFVRVGADTCRVTVTFSDGTRITRERGPRVNRYVVEKDGERTESAGPGAGVPPEVQAAHGMLPLRLDDDTELSLNLGGQLEGPFLMDCPGSVRAKAIGRVVGAHIIDAAIRDVLADASRAAREEKQLGADIAAREAELKGYEDLPAQEEALRRAEEMLERAGELRRRAEQLAALGARLGRNRVETDRQRELLDRLAGVGEAEGLAARAERLAERYARLVRLAERWRDNAGRSAHWQRVVEGLAGLGEAEALCEQAARRAERLRQLREVGDRLARRERDRRKLAAELEQARALEGQLREQYGRILLRLGRCPTCGAAITPAQVPAVLDEVFGAQGG